MALSNRITRGNVFLKKLLSGVVLPLFCLCVPTQVDSADVNAMDRAMVKALYAYNFGKFTTWPDSKLNASTDRFQFCILGQNQFSQNILSMFSGKMVQGIPLSFTAFDTGLISEKALSACHVLYISKSEKHRLYTILQSVKGRPILTVSDIEKFSDQGGMITLTEKKEKVGFQINPEALNRAEISISSKIMKLAEIVNDKQR